MEIECKKGPRSNDDDDYDGGGGGGAAAAAAAEFEPLPVARAGSS